MVKQCSYIVITGRLLPDMCLTFFDANYDITVWLIKSDVPFCSMTSVHAAVHSKQVCSKACISLFCIVVPLSNLR